MISESSVNIVNIVLSACNLLFYSLLQAKKIIQSMLQCVIQCIILYMPLRYALFGAFFLPKMLHK